MTLTEYLNQEDPVRMPSVCLQEGEYDFGLTLPVGYKNSGQTTTQVFIKAYPGVEYIVNNKRGSLYTTDIHGNEKSQSCFHLPYS